MTPSPKEKAKELVEHYAETIPHIEHGVLMERDWETAKQCALISANEAEQAEYNVLIKFNIVTETYKSKYWQEVKQ